MLRRLALVIAAVACGLLASSLLRTEKRTSAAPPPSSGTGRRPRRCGAPTRSGAPCGRRPAAGHDRCWQHR